MDMTFLNSAPKITTENNDTAFDDSTVFTNTQEHYNDSTSNSEDCSWETLEELDCSTACTIDGYRSFYETADEATWSPEVDLMKIRAAHDPPSYYHIPEMNKILIDVVPRFDYVPSQYVLDSLQNFAVMDDPHQAYKLKMESALSIFHKDIS